MGIPVVREERRVSLKEVLVFTCYRLLERIDGENGFLLIPYKFAQPCKMMVLDILK